MEKEVMLRYWKKGMKIDCPVCGNKVSEPYTCKNCKTVLKPKVRIG